MVTITVVYTTFAVLSFSWLYFHYSKKEDDKVYYIIILADRVQKIILTFKLGNISEHPVSYIYHRMIEPVNIFLNSVCQYYNIIYFLE